MNALNLIDRYVAEIGKGLPRRNRADIESEIRSTLQDMLDERAAREARPVDDAMVRDVLKGYGAPSRVAASYRGTPYLIGPRMFPMFEMVTKIVVTVLVAVSLAGLAVGIGKDSSGPAFIQALGLWAAQLFASLTSALGSIVIAFAILERVRPTRDFGREKDEDWDPAELEREPDPAEVKPAEPIFAILFTVIWLVIVNVYPDLIGFGFATGGHWTSIPVLSDAFFRYLPWMNLLGVLQIGLNVWLLRSGAWNMFSRIADIVLEVAGIVLAGFMLAGPSLVDVSPEKLANTPLAEASGTLAPLLGMLPTLVLSIVIVVSTLEVGKAIYKLLTRTPAAVPFPAK